MCRWVRGDTALWGRKGGVGMNGDGYLGVMLDAFLHDGMDCELALVDHGERS